jgi:hypothetical protein
MSASVPAVAAEIVWRDALSAPVTVIMRRSPYLAGARIELFP